MTEEEARQQIADTVPRETLDQLDVLARVILAANQSQNLIAKSTEGVIWQRHMLDSAQLLWLAQATGRWLDIGSGGGFPGLVVGVMRDDKTWLVEPRAKRAAFLLAAIQELGLEQRISVEAGRVERLVCHTPAAVISARAVAALPSLLAMAEAQSDADTVWVLPKGRNAASEVAEARREWQGEFRLVPSLSDPESMIVVARGIRRKTRR